MEKAIEHGKEHRKPYYGSKRFDRTCRDHGSCPWCQGNRKHKYRKPRLDEKEELDDMPWNKRNREEHD